MQLAGGSVPAAGLPGAAPGPAGAEGTVDPELMSQGGAVLLKWG